MAKGIYTGDTWNETLEIPVNTKGLFHFDSNLTDSAGISAATSYGTVSYGAGKFNNGINLNGAGCVRVPYSTNLDFGNSNFTIAGWYKRNAALNGKWEGLFSQRGYYSGSYKSSGLTLTFTDANKLRLEMFRTYSTVIRADSASDVSSYFPVGEWVHVAVVRNGATITAYVDGIAFASISVSTYSIYNNSFPFVIGGCPVQTTSYLSSYTEFFNGAVDEFIIVNGAALWTENFIPPSALAYGETRPHVDQARKITGMYIGINGVARRIKKAYIGIDGKARRCYYDSPYYWEGSYWTGAATAVKHSILDRGSYWECSLTATQSSYTNTARAGIELLLRGVKSGDKIVAVYTTTGLGGYRNFYIESWANNTKTGTHADNSSNVTNNSLSFTAAGDTIRFFVDTGATGTQTIGLKVHSVTVNGVQVYPEL